MTAQGDETAAHELKLFTENDSQIYHSQTLSILKNLATKAAKGTYTHEGGTKLFMYLAENGAKKYSKEFSDGRDWNQMFTVPTRRMAAKEWAEEFETEYKLGNYDNLLPKKYQKKG